MSFNEGSSATDYVTDVTDVTDVLATDFVTDYVTDVTDFRKTEDGRRKTEDGRRKKQESIFSHSPTLPLFHSPTLPLFPLPLSHSSLCFKSQDIAD
ncbi:hypothetical protein QUA35_28685 [Microcoleus sp. N9_B2]|uniref:hypothetical protein n=1 Tax=unclassified Microcoleus TaxID=2642155 RepID=UPI002FD1B6D8